MKTVPVIQQGLVNGDPDVDAIYRLTRKYSKQLLNVEFDEYAPPLALGPRQYAPTNSQNTLYHYDAFWSLILPLNVTFREVDILRGYISIRLLQEMNNARVAFFAPNALQIRNAHSYHADYKDEKRLYDDIQAFVKALDEWTCKFDSLKECLVDCVENLIEKKFLNQVELEFYKAWVTTLDMLGYAWPKLAAKKRSLEVKSASVEIFYKSQEQIHSSNSNQNEPSLLSMNLDFARIRKIESLCGFDTNKVHVKFETLKTVIFVTTASTIQELETLNLFYAAHFGYIVVCFSGEPVSEVLNQTIITVLVYNKEDRKAFRDCISDAFSLGFKQQSFLLARNFQEFSFWSERVSLEATTEQEIPDSLNYDSVNFVRKNIANGIRRVKNFNKPSSFNSYCQFHKENRHESILATLKTEIDKLTWHQNDLASENCQNLQSKLVWMLDFHVGPKTDLASTLIHLGQRVILGMSLFFFHLLSLNFF